MMTRVIPSRQRRVTRDEVGGVNPGKVESHNFQDAIWGRVAASLQNSSSSTTRSTTRMVQNVTVQASSRAMPNL